MRIARLNTPSGPEYAYGEGNVWIPCTDPFALAKGTSPAAIGAPVPIAMAELLPPCEPRVVIGIAQNRGINNHPLPVQAWLKSARSVAPNGREVYLTRNAGIHVIEGEVAVVIGRDTTGLTQDNVLDYIFGITAVNDVSNPERSAFDERNFEGKGGIDYTPLGSWIETEFDNINDVALTVSINGEVRAETNSSALPVPIAECIEYVARWLPLGKGDVIMTGACFSHFAASPGDEIDITVADIPLHTPLR